MAIEGAYLPHTLSAWDYCISIQPVGLYSLGICTVLDGRTVPDEIAQIDGK